MRRKVAAVTWGQSHFQPTQPPCSTFLQKVLSLFHRILSWRPGKPCPLCSALVFCWKLLIAASGFNW